MKQLKRLDERVGKVIVAIGAMGVTMAFILFFGILLTACLHLRGLPEGYTQKVRCVGTDGELHDRCFDVYCYEGDEAWTKVQEARSWWVIDYNKPGMVCLRDTFSRRRYEQGDYQDKIRSVK